MTILKTKHRLIMSHLYDSDWIKEKLYSEFPQFLEQLSLCSYILIEDIVIKGTKAYPVCYVMLTVEVFDEPTFRKLKLKYATLYQKFIKNDAEKPYEIPYNSPSYTVYTLKGEYL